MKTIWKLFVGDIRRITSNVVSIIIVIGLVVIPGIFTWFNVAASWDPFANTAHFLKIIHSHLFLPQQHLLLTQVKKYQLKQQLNQSTYHSYQA